MSYVNFNRALTRAQIEALGEAGNATNGKIYFAKDGGIYVGNAEGAVERKADYTPLMEKTFAPYTCTAANEAKGYLALFNVHPTSDNWVVPWHVRYILDVETSNTNCVGHYECYVSQCGSQLPYMNWNELYSSSYYPIYNHMVWWHNTAAKYGNREDHPVKMGVRIYSAYGATTVSRTFRVRIIEMEGCTVDFLDTPATRDSFYNSTDYVESQPNGYATGLQETGDANTVPYQLYDYGTSYLIRSTSTPLYRYKICGFDGQSRVIPVSLTNQTSNTAVAQTPCGEPMVVSKGLVFYNTTTALTAATSRTPSSTVYRYCGPSTTWHVYNFSSMPAAYNDVYLKGTYNPATDEFTLDTTSSTSYYVFVPQGNDGSSIFENGYYYWYVGYVSGTVYSGSIYYADFTLEHPLFYYNGADLVPAFSSIVEDIKTPTLYVGDDLTTAQKNNNLEVVTDILNGGNVFVGNIRVRLKGLTVFGSPEYIDSNIYSISPNNSGYEIWIGISMELFRDWLYASYRFDMDSTGGLPGLSTLSQYQSLIAYNSFPAVTLNASPNTDQTQSYTAGGTGAENVRKYVDVIDLAGVPFYTIGDTTSYGGGTGEEKYWFYYDTPDKKVKVTVNSDNSIVASWVPRQDAFIAEYNVTTYAECLEAYNAGKMLFVKIADGSEYRILSLDYVDLISGEEQFAFSSTTGSEFRWVTVDANTTPQWYDNSFPIKYPGTLNTTNTTALSTSGNESLSGTVNLHKISKTGYYNDLIGKPGWKDGGHESAIMSSAGSANVGSYSSGYIFDADGEAIDNSYLEISAEGSGSASHGTIYFDGTFDPQNEIEGKIHAEGRGSTAEGYIYINPSDLSGQERLSIEATGLGSHAEGYTCGDYTETISGYVGNIIASGNGSHAEGCAPVLASGNGSHAEGTLTTASGTASHAEGIGTTASGNYSHAEGNLTVADGSESHAEGQGEKLSLLYRISGGAGVTTYTTSSEHNLQIGDIIKWNDKYRKVTAVPSTTSFTVDATFSSTAIPTAAGDIIRCTGVSYGPYSHSEGYRTQSIGEAGHTEGMNTIASGVGSHAEGDSTTASGNRSHAEGDQTTASGVASHAEGMDTIASGSSSHAEGFVTTASGDYSHTEGAYTTTQNLGEHAEGRYNKSNKASTSFGNAGNTISSIGIGTGSSAKKNAFEVMQNGDAYLYGLGTYNGTNPSHGVNDIKTIINSKTSTADVKKVGFAQNIFYNPVGSYDTYISLFNHDKAQATAQDQKYAIESISTRTEDNNYFIDLVLNNYVRQSYTNSNNNYPLAIAGMQYSNMTSGNCLPIYYSPNIQVNPSTGVLSVNDVKISGTSAATTISNLTTGKQDKLVSGTNIKTINSTTLLGSGNINTPDTKNTAGSTNSTSKLFLIGATEQSANPQTHSNSTLYIDSTQTLVAKTARVTDNDFYIGSASASQCHQQYDATNKCLKFIFD